MIMTMVIVYDDGSIFTDDCSPLILLHHLDWCFLFDKRSDDKILLDSVLGEGFHVPLNGFFS